MLENFPSIAFDTPERSTDVRAWHGHVPFAFWLVGALRPRTIVELGTHKGDSYCAFCQAVDRLGLDTRCYAVDTWRGDLQAGTYGEDVHVELSEYHDRRYASFSRLLQSTFDDASQHFATGTIDLLHIDGLHTYDAVRHDFEVWRERLSERAVVLLHDTNVREKDFGVWRLWEELSARYPSFEFLHSNGLGVLAPGASPPAELARLFEARGQRVRDIRRLFGALGAAGGDSPRIEEMQRRVVEQRNSFEQALAAAQQRADAIERQSAERQGNAEQCVTTLGAELAAAQEHCSQLARDTAELRRALVEASAARDEAVDHAAEHLLAVVAERHSLDARLRELDARVEDVETLREQAVCEANDRRASEDRLQDQLDAARREVTALESVVDSRNAEIEQLHGALGATQDSLSWRVTRPLRTVTRRFPRFAAVLEKIIAVFWASLRFRRTDLQRRSEIRLIRASGMFGHAFYLASNPDVAASGMDPIFHYVMFGAAEGRDPSPSFATRFYLDTNPDVRGAGVNPLVHYVAYGRQEKRPTFPTPGLPSTDTATAGAERIDFLEWIKGVSRPSSHHRAVLIVDHRLPTPDQDSGSVRIFAVAKLFRRAGYDVTFVSDDANVTPEYEEGLRQLGIGVLYGADATERHLQERGASYTLVILSRPSVAERYLTLARAWAVFAEIVYDTVDLHWLRLARAAELLRDPELARSADEHRKLEAYAITSSDVVLAVTETEKQKILKHWPDGKVGVIPNIHVCRALPRRWAARRDLMFIGGYQHAPNVDAVTWFATEVLPLVRRELPDARFRIVGSHPPESLRKLVSECVELVGWVRDPEPLFDEARVFVAPLRYGAGMKGKIGQAMSLGLPVVTTSVGAEGMLLEDGVHAMIADSAEDFAAAVIKLYRDSELWGVLRDGALAHIERHFSEAAVGLALNAMFPVRSPKASNGVRS